jgi:hypothetical protein
MVRIEIDAEVWNVFKRSWALLGVRTDEELVRMLEDDLWEKSNNVLDDAETQLIDDTPEAYVRREIGLEKERLGKPKPRKSRVSGE